MRRTATEFAPKLLQATFDQAVKLRQGGKKARAPRAGSYGARTRVGVHRSRYELECILGRYGASDVAFVEADAKASIQFAMHGRYIQLALPLPDPSGKVFTHTPTGRQRAIVAQERAYEQALREHWRSLVLAVRGKLQSVESGISTFEEEFNGFLVPQFSEDKEKRRTPKAVNWLLGGSHVAAIGLVAAFLVPASAVGAFALPPSLVGHLSAPFHGSVANAWVASSDGSRPVALGRSDDWSQSDTQTGATLVSALGDSRTLPPAPAEHGSVDEGSAAAVPDTSTPVDGNVGGAPADVAVGSQSSDPPVTTSGAAPTVSRSTIPPPSSGGGKSDKPSGGGKSNPPPVSGPAESSDTGSSFGSQPPATGPAPTPDGKPGKGGGPSDNGPGSSNSPGSSPSPGNGNSQPPAGDGGTVTPPSDTGGTPSPHDNGNHNGADNGLKNGADNNAGAAGDATPKPPKGKP